MKKYASRIYLCGFMGAGKTTAGRLLAKRLKYIFVDLDKYIEKKEHKTISSIFSKFGEAGFRNLERQYLEELSSWQNVVIALGGGTLKDQETVGFIKNSGLLIYINVDLSTVLERVKTQPKAAPATDRFG
jgi:shikimate kinase